MDAVYEHLKVLRIHVRVDAVAEVGYPAISAKCGDQLLNLSLNVLLEGGSQGEVVCG